MRAASPAGPCPTRQGPGPTTEDLGCRPAVTASIPASAQTASTGAKNQVPGSLSCPPATRPPVSCSGSGRTLITCTSVAAFLQERVNCHRATATIAGFHRPGTALRTWPTPMPAFSPIPATPPSHPFAKPGALSLLFLLLLSYPTITLQRPCLRPRSPGLIYVPVAILIQRRCTQVSTAEQGGHGGVRRE